MQKNYQAMDNYATLFCPKW